MRENRSDRQDINRTSGRGERKMKGGGQGRRRDSGRGKRERGGGGGMGEALDGRGGRDSRKRDSKLGCLVAF